MVSEADPQECIIVRGDDQDFNTDLPETLCAKIQPGQSATGKSVMGYRVTINGQEYTVPASKCKIDPNRPGWMEVSSEHCFFLSSEINKFCVIQDLKNRLSKFCHQVNALLTNR